MLLLMACTPISKDMVCCTHWKYSGGESIGDALVFGQDSLKGLYIQDDWGIKKNGVLIGKIKMRTSDHLDIELLNGETAEYSVLVRNCPTE